MGKTLTRQGARNVTVDLDKVANVIQHRADVLGIPPHIAEDFAYRCDLVSDHIERHAISLEAGDDAEEEEEEEEAEGDAQGKEAGESQEVDDSPVSQDQNKPETYYEDSKSASEDEKLLRKMLAEEGMDKGASPEFAQPPKDETGESVEPNPPHAPHWDANAIGDDRGGPYKQDEDEDYMGGEFSQEEFHALRDKQQAGQVPGVDAKLASSLDRMFKLANDAATLSSLQNDLKAVQAQLDTLKGTGSLSSDVGKQVVAIGKIRDALIKLDATGEGEPADVYGAASRAAQAVNEQLPYLQQVASSAGMDTGSPTEMMKFEAMLDNSKLKKLISLGTRIVSDAAKLGGQEKAAATSETSPSKPETSTVEASTVEASEDNDFGYNLT